ncbi:Imm53 family immunity protein [Streptomyces niveus]|uniref:Imm53 family immunity protein n=1 Tax=Streptomyces niveus TaxID=193462 RepID=UPI0036324420
MKIATLDNPGWTVSIDLEETELEERDYIRQEINRAPQDWIRAWTAEKTFHAACGPATSPRPSRCSVPGRPRSRPRRTRSGPDGSPPAAVRRRRRATPVRPGGLRPGRG